jgi:hypothetical protein
MTGELIRDGNNDAEVARPALGGGVAAFIEGCGLDPKGAWRDC